MPLNYNDIIATLPGNATSYIDNIPSPGFNKYRVVAIAGGVPSAAAPCDVVVGDDCVNAVEVFDGTTLFDTTSATIDGPPEPGLCDAPTLLAEIVPGQDPGLAAYTDITRLSVFPVGSDSIRS